MRRVLPILSFILLITIQSQAQSSRTIPSSETTDRFVKLYPNPATSYIILDLQKDYKKGLSVQVYSFLGKKIQEIPLAQQKTTINLTDFNRGLYMYHLLDATGKVIESGKFQVSK